VRECLKALPQRKWVFTNCNEKHARLALESLDLLVSHTCNRPAALHVGC
jgi:FMN phosphatase YigB (HAD superfamily)